MARKGFIYQDHVGVKFLMELMMAENDCDIFFENEDDIVVIQKSAIPVLVEMIQVKSNNLISRWSVSQIIDLEVVQKSLKRGRCAEEVDYKLITAYDVDDMLDVLKEPLGSIGRTAEKLDGVCEKIKLKKNDIPANEKGHTVTDWVNRCVWSKFPENIESLESANLLLLEKMLNDCFQTVLFIDQKQELYQKLLANVQLASSLERTTFDKAVLQAWFEKQLKDTVIPKKGTERLIEKMVNAQLDDALIETAKELKWLYSRETLESRYIGKAVINDFKISAESLLLNLKLKLDAGDLEALGVNEGSSFHKHCVEQVDALGAEQGIRSELAEGCMYDITNRCLHRFKKPLP